MPNTSPPFDPPYYTLNEGGNGTQHVETLADGSIRSVDWQPPDLSFTAQSASQSNVMAKSPSRQSKPGNQSGKVYLKVPFAEKDEAKALGARWDAAQKKWYVPDGKDPDQFARWSLDA